MFRYIRIRAAHIDVGRKKSAGGALPWKTPAGWTRGETERRSCLPELAANVQKLAEQTASTTENTRTKAALIAANLLIRTAAKSPEQRAVDRTQRDELLAKLQEQEEPTEEQVKAVVDAYPSLTTREQHEVLTHYLVAAVTDGAIDDEDDAGGGLDNPPT